MLNMKKLKNWWQRKSKGAKITWLSIIGILLVLRISAPSVIKYYTLKSINNNEHYTATLEDVDLHLYRGAIVFQELNIKSNETGQNLPFFYSESIDASIQWSKLFQGALVGEIYLQHPSVNFITGFDDGRKDNFSEADEVDWLRKIETFFPASINKFAVIDGNIRYVDLSHSPNIDLTANNIDLFISNLSNSTSINGSKIANAALRGQVMNQAPIYARLEFDPFDTTGTYDLDVSLEKLDMTQLNDFSKAYTNVDIERGEFSLFSEVGSKNGNLSGYIKPVADELKVLNLKKDVKKGPLNVIWEGITELGTTIFSNIPNDKLAAKIEFEGDVYAVDIKLLKSFGSLLSNAFFNSINRELDNKIELNLAENSKLTLK